MTQFKISSTDNTADYAENKISAGDNVTLTKITSGGYETLRIDVADQIDESLIGSAQVDGYTSLVSSNDTKPDFLQNKIIAGNNIQVDVITNGTIQTLQISAPDQIDESLVGSFLDGYSIKVTADDTLADFLQNKLTAGDNIQLDVITNGTVQTIQISAAYPDVTGLQQTVDEHYTQQGLINQSTIKDLDGYFIGTGVVANVASGDGYLVFFAADGTNNRTYLAGDNDFTYNRSTSAVNLAGSLTATAYGTNTGITTTGGDEGGVGIIVTGGGSGATGGDGLSATGIGSGWGIQSIGGNVGGSGINATGGGGGGYGLAATGNGLYPGIITTGGNSDSGVGIEAHAGNTNALAGDFYGSIRVDKNVSIGGNIINATLSETFQTIRTALDGYGGTPAISDGYIVFGTGTGMAGDNDLYYNRETSAVTLAGSLVVTTPDNIVGITITGGSGTATGLVVTGGADGGIGASFTGVGNATGILGTGGGHNSTGGIFQGFGSGQGLTASGGSNGIGLTATGFAAKSGVIGIGGETGGEGGSFTGGTGNGLGGSFTGGADNGGGITGTASGSGVGIAGYSNDNDAILGTSTSGNAGHFIGPILVEGKITTTSNISVGGDILNTTLSENLAALKQAADGYAQNQTVTENKNAQEQINQSVLQALDAYGAGATEGEHYNQQQQINQSVLQALDGYSTLPISGSAGDGYIAFFTGSTNIAGDNDLYWDRVNNQLNVSQALNITGSDAASTATTPLSVKDAAGNVLLTVRNDGSTTIGYGTVDGASLTLISTSQFVGVYSPRYFGNTGTTNNLVRFGDYTTSATVSRIDCSSLSAASGTRSFFDLSPIWTGGGTTSATDFLINRTETAIGTGNQLLFNAQVNSGNKFSIDTQGKAYHYSPDGSGLNLTISHDGTDGYIYTSQGSLRLSPTSNLVKVDGYVLPSTDDAYGLGDEEHRWRNLFLSGGEGLHLRQNAADNDTNTERDWRIRVDSGGGLLIRQANDSALNIMTTDIGTTALGYGTVITSGIQNTALGAAATASNVNDRTTAVGYSATATGAKAQAFGATSSVTGNNSIAVGYGASTLATSSVALGYLSSIPNSGYTGAIAIGATATAAGANSISIGSAAGGGSGAISMGTGTSGTGTNSIVIGTSAANGSASSVCIGATAGIAPDNSVAIGFGATNSGVSNTGSISMGYNALTNGLGSITIGYNATTGNFNHALAIGEDATSVTHNDGQIGTAAKAINITTYGYIKTKSWNAATESSEYLSIAHNSIDGYISTGVGNIILAPAGFNQDAYVGIEAALGLRGLINTPLNTSGYSKLYVKASDGDLYFRDDAGAEERITTTVSDITLKTDIQPIQEALKLINNMRGVRFKWNEVAGKFGEISGKSEIGVIAQEIENILPEIVVKNKLHKKVQYEKLTAVLIEGIKELSKENNALEERLRILEDLIRGK